MQVSQNIVLPPLLHDHILWSIGHLTKLCISSLLRKDLKGRFISALLLLPRKFMVTFPSFYGNLNSLVICAGGCLPSSNDRKRNKPDPTLGAGNEKSWLVPVSLFHINYQQLYTRYLNVNNFMFGDNRNIHSNWVLPPPIGYLV